MSKLKFAVVGVGEEGIGNRHSEAVLQHKETELTAICEIDGELAKKKAAIEKELQEEINKRKSIEYYEAMAKEYADNPRLAALVNELKELGE